MHPFIRTIVTSRWLGICLAVALWVIAYPIAQQLKSQRSVTTLFAAHNPLLRDYQDMKTWFGDQDVLILMYRDQDLASQAGMERCQALAERLATIPDVASVLTPQRLNQLAEESSKNPLQLLTGASTPEPNAIPRLLRGDDPAAVELEKLFAGYTHSADYQYAAAVVIANTDQEGQTLQALNQAVQWWSLQPGVSEVSLVGEPVLVEQAFSLVETDGASLAIITILLLSLVLLIVLWDWRLVMLTALVIGWSIVVTRALMVMLGISLSLIASIMTAIVTVVTVTAVVHLGVRYQTRRRRGDSVRQAMLESFRCLALPIFWTCATDAAGFFALGFSEILPVQEFGWMIGFSAINVCLALLLIGPTCLSLPEFPSARQSPRFAGGLAARLRTASGLIASRCVRHYRLIVAAGLVLMGLAVLLVANGETESSFLRNFRADSSIAQDYGNVEAKLGGAGVWDLVLDVPYPVTDSMLTKVDQLEQQLREDLAGPNGLTKVISVADAAQAFGQSRLGSLMNGTARIEAMRLRLPSFVGALISKPLAANGVPDDTKNRCKLRIMLRSSEALTTAQKQALMASVASIANEHQTQWAADSNWTANAAPLITGYYVMMTELVDQLIADQWRCFGVSAALIWILMVLANRSLRLASAALLPNLLPAFLVLAVTLLVGEKVNMGAAMIAAVSVGLSIDSSIHLMSHYRRRRMTDRPVSVVVVSAARQVGVAVCLSTLALVVGFGVLGGSEFIPTATFGTLVACTLVVGTVINLSLLPASIRMMDRDQ